MGDETTKIFLNSQGNREGLDPDIVAFLDYVNGLSAKGRFTKSIENEVRKVKEHKETRWEYMTLMMEIKKQWQEGHAEGRAEGKAEAARSLMESLHCTTEKAMELLKIPAELQPKILALL